MSQRKKIKKSAFILPVDLFWKESHIFFHQHNKSSCKYFIVTIRKLRANVSATLKNEELTGLNYWESEQLPVSEHHAYMSFFTLPVLTDLQSVYTRQLMTKLKLHSNKVFQAAEHG